MLDIQSALENTKSFTVPMEDIKVRSRNEFEVRGNIIPVTDTAFKDLLKLVGLTQKTVAHINESIHQSAGFMLVKELMKAMSSKKGTNVSLLVDIDTRKVNRICLEGQTTGSNQAISPSAIEDLINYACEKSNKIKLTDTFITDGGTKVTFNLKWDVAIPLVMKGEDVKFGKQITWDLLGDTLISDFAERLICTNGMTGIVPTRPTPLSNRTTPDEWYQILFKDLINPNKDKIKGYEDKVFQAMQTNLSVYEFNTIKAHLINHWRDDAARIMRYLGDERWRNDYKNRAIDLDAASAGQLRNCPTPVNAWDAINCLTDLASHTYNSKVADYVKKDTQKLAGRFLNKTWDENQQLLNVPSYKNNGPSVPGFES